MTGRPRSLTRDVTTRLGRDIQIATTGPICRDRAPSARSNSPRSYRRGRSNAGAREAAAHRGSPRSAPKTSRSRRARPSKSSGTSGRTGDSSSAGSRRRAPDGPAGSSPRTRSRAYKPSSQRRRVESDRAHVREPVEHARHDATADPVAALGRIHQDHANPRQGRPVTDRAPAADHAVVGAARPRNRPGLRSGGSASLRSAGSSRRLRTAGGRRRCRPGVITRSATGSAPPVTADPRPSPTTAVFHRRLSSAARGRAPRCRDRPSSGWTPAVRRRRSANAPGAGSRPARSRSTRPPSPGTG